ncbi:MAG: radical SAM protein [Candidatus Bathyarchaeota archaeon]|nr:radical SAM protein [Candidatus Bathyarchaeota archaeon]
MVPLISSFDPWRSGLCTCPPKLTFNPYTGCDHQCAYCYASSYIPNFKDCRPKKDLLVSLKKEAAKLKGETISIANSSDPYPRTEASAGLTRRCLEILTESNCKIQIITKSNIVTRDDDLLSKVPVTVALTITTDDDSLARQIEPFAPLPSQRIRAAQDLIKTGIPVSVRIDPIIPMLNDEPQKLISELASIGVKHLTCSTYKAKPDNWMRLTKTLPQTVEKLKPLYFQQGERVGGSTLLPKEFRYKLLKSIRDLALANGMQFGVCREGLNQLNTAACDGSWLMPNDKEAKQRRLA